MNNESALDQYRQVSVEAKIPSSNPHQLVEMLLEGLLEKLAKASGAIEQGDVSIRGAALSSGIRIIDGLRASLDYTEGGEIADNLRSMYDYMERRLAEANANSDSEIVAEVASLVKQIKTGWDAIPDELRGV